MTSHVSAQAWRSHAHDHARRARSTAIAAAASVLVVSGCVSPEIGPAAFVAPPVPPSATSPLPLEGQTDTPGTPSPWVWPTLRHTTSSLLCPAGGWQGLTVEATNLEVAPYLQSMPACMQQGMQQVTQTWLRNNSELVWSFQVSPTVPGSAIVVDRRETPRGSSFHAIMGAGNTELRLLAPHEEVFLGTAPQLVRWTVDAPATLAWQAHDRTLDQITSFGTNRLESALKRQGTEGAALAQCTLSGFQVGVSAGKLMGPDPSGLTELDTKALLEAVVGAGKEGKKCVAAAQRVRAPTRLQTPLPDLSQRLAMDVRSPRTLEQIHPIMSAAQRAKPFVGQVLRAL